MKMSKVQKDAEAYQEKIRFCASYLYYAISEPDLFPYTDEIGQAWKSTWAAMRHEHKDNIEITGHEDWPAVFIGAMETLAGGEEGLMQPDEVSSEVQKMSDGENGDTLESIREEVSMVASETAPSWKARCYRMAAALGLDFGNEELPDDLMDIKMAQERKSAYLEAAYLAKNNGDMKTYDALKDLAHSA